MCPSLLEGSKGSGGDSGGLVFVVCCNTLGSRGRRNSRTFISPNHDLLENHPIERITDLENISSSNILFERSSLAFCSNLTMRSGSREIASYAVLFEIVLLIPQSEKKKIEKYHLFQNLVSSNIFGNEMYIYSLYMAREILDSAPLCSTQDSSFASMAKAMKAMKAAAAPAAPAKKKAMKAMKAKAMKAMKAKK